MATNHSQLLSELEEMAKINFKETLKAIVFDSPIHSKLSLVFNDVEQAINFIKTSKEILDIHKEPRYKNITFDLKVCTVIMY